MQLGASTQMFKERPLDRDVLARMRDAGIASIEISDYHRAFDYADRAALERVRRVLDELGLHLNSVHVHLAQLRNPYRPDSPQRRIDPGPFGRFDPDCDLGATAASRASATAARYVEAIDAIAALGGDILVTHDVLVPRRDEETADTARQDRHDARRTAFVANVQRIAVHAESRGVQIALENASFGVGRDAEGLRDLVEAIDRSNVGVVLDTGHLHLHGDVAAAVGTVADHLLSLHIHDNDTTTDAHQLPGEGTIAWDRVLPALRRTGYAGVFTYELTRGDYLPTIRDNFARLTSASGEASPAEVA